MWIFRPIENGDTGTAFTWYRILSPVYYFFLFRRYTGRTTASNLLFFFINQHLIFSPADSSPLEKVKLFSPLFSSTFTNESARVRFISLSFLQIWLAYFPFSFLSLAPVHIDLPFRLYMNHLLVFNTAPFVLEFASFSFLNENKKRT